MSDSLSCEDVNTQQGSENTDGAQSKKIIRSKLPVSAIKKPEPIKRIADEESVPSGVPPTKKPRCEVPPQPVFVKPQPMNEKNKENLPARNAGTTNNSKPRPIAKVKSVAPVKRESVMAQSRARLTSNQLGNARPSVEPAGRASCIEIGGAKAKPNVRAKWDFKGRLEDAQEELKKYKKLKIDLEQQIEFVTQRNDVLENTTKSLQQQVTDLKNNLEKTSEQLGETTSELEEMKTAYKNTLEQLSEKTNEANNLIAEKKSLIQNLQKLQEKHDIFQTELETQRNNCGELMECKTKLEVKVEQQASMISHMISQCQRGEIVRRHLHNWVQELKGNIRVFCRVRPLLSKEQGTTMINFNFINDEITQKIEISRVAEETNGSKAKTVKFEFQFDRIFSQDSLQEDVFDEISQLVQSSVDGYNVCVFAYGQTGSGKTYTMEGPEFIKDFVLESENPQLGMIPRAIQKVFTTVEELQSLGWKYTFEASILEIYNENIQDLLVDKPDPSVKYEIRMANSPENDVYVTNLTTVSVQTVEEVYVLLKKARKNRVVAANRCNEYSSRSHSVFQLRLKGVNESSHEQCKGMLNLIDLAGSERLKEVSFDNNPSVRMRETKNINLSLSNLGNVIMALGHKNDHIPYRNSKLTHLLMPCLGGNSKTLMFVNLSPREDHFNETMNSLRFADKVSKCHIGRARKVH